MLGLSLKCKFYESLFCLSSKDSCFCISNKFETIIFMVKEINTNKLNNLSIFKLETLLSLFLKVLFVGLGFIKFAFKCEES